MKFPEIDIKNFLGVGEAKLALDDRGLILVQGVNLDDPSSNSNGSGKSSMIDALFWCLYGATARGLTGDDVVNHVTGKDCVVKTLVVDGKSTAVITRWRKAKGFHKPSGVSIEIDGTAMTGGTDALTQEIITGFIGSSQDVFAASVYAGQEVMPDIPSMTDRQLKSLIEEAAGIDTIEQAYEIARDRVSAAKHEEENKLRASQRATEIFVSASESLVLNTARAKEWTVRQAEKIETQKATVRAKVKEAKSLAAEIKTMEPEKVEADIAKIAEKIEALDLDVAECDNKIEAVGAENIEKDRLQAIAQRDTSKQEASRREANRLITEYKRLKADEENIEAKLLTPCGECGKPITKDDLADALTALQAKVKAAREKCVAEKKLFEALEETAKISAAIYGAYIAGMTDTSAEVAKKRDIQTEIGNLRSASRKLVERVASMSAMRGRLEALKDAARSQNERLQELEEEPHPYSAILTDSEAALETYKADRAEKEAEYFEASAKTALAQATAEVFGPKGVRAHILDTVTPFLNDRTSHYLAALSDGSLEAVWSTLTESRAGELKEKFSIITAKYGSGSFAGLSGGEKRKVRLSTMLALQDLVASRATKPIELWVGDEIDDALDVAGLERLMSLLEMKSREKGTVLIVSHRDLADWVRDVVTVTMAGKFSTVEGPICLPV